MKWLKKTKNIYKKNLQPLNVKVYSEILCLLQLQSLATGISYSELTRLALRDYIRDWTIDSLIYSVALRCMRLYKSTNLSATEFIQEIIKDCKDCGVPENHIQRIIKNFNELL